MERPDDPRFRFDLSVHHEASHILANAREKRLFHCMLYAAMPSMGGWAA